jgi:hypothetical protein
MNTTIVNVALPTRVQELHASTSSNGSLMLQPRFAASVLAAENLGDRADRAGPVLSIAAMALLI